MIGRLGEWESGGAGTQARGGGFRGEKEKEGEAMDIGLRDRFAALWGKYFDGAELPLGFYYTDDEACGEHLSPAAGHACLIGQLAAVRKGKTLCVSRDSIGCFGGKRYLGFSGEVMPNFEYFLSCGIPGKLEGERYKKSPEVVKAAMEKQGAFEAPAKYAVFKRWDKLEVKDEVEIVIFLAVPDVLSGLFTLSNFDETYPFSVIAPFGAGCGTITQYPYQEKGSEHPRSVIGMFDVSARPFVPGGTLSFATPMEKFARMVGEMEESFLITGSWAKVQRRVPGRGCPSTAFHKSEWTYEMLYFHRGFAPMALQDAPFRRVFTL